MSIPSLAGLLRNAREFCRLAQEAADEANLPLTENFSEKSAKKHYSRDESKRLSLLADVQPYRNLPHYDCLQAWGAILCFDMRRSSDLTELLGPRGWHITLNVYMPVLLQIVEGLNGEVVGLRGDGAIVCFGRVEQGQDKPPVTEAQGKKAIYAACDCGDAIVKAMQWVVNPVLRESQILTSKVLGGSIKVGVGIDVGNFVATRVGLISAHDLTANGRPVNRSCKFSHGEDEVILTHRAYDIFPSKPGGKTRFVKDHRKEGGFILRYPASYKTLA